MATYIIYENSAYRFESAAMAPKEIVEDGQAVTQAAHDKFAEQLNAESDTLYQQILQDRRKAVADEFTARAKGGDPMTALASMIEDGTLSL